MSALNNLEGEESFEAFRHGVFTLLNSFDDPKEAKQALEEEGYEGVLHHVNMDQDEYMVMLEMVHALAKEIADDNPELFAEMKEKYGIEDRE